MPAIVILAMMLLTAGATALGIHLLGPSASEKQVQCVEKMTEALSPKTVNGVKDIVNQCKERYIK